MNEEDPTLTIARLAARVARLEELLAERSRAFRVLAETACDEDLEALLLIAAGLLLPSRSGVGAPRGPGLRSSRSRDADPVPPPPNTSKVTDAEVRLVGPILQRLIWADRSTRARVEEYGATVVPTNFYSNTPSIAEINRSYEYAGHTPPYLTASLFVRTTLGPTLKALDEYSAEFDPPLDGDATDCTRFFWRNTQFSYSDAMAYYCFVRLLRPKAIIEIGGGFSTLVALEAARKNGVGSVTCIEPFPRPFLERNNQILLKRLRAEAIDADFLNQSLADGDILFIDSTHTVKTGSDCLHIYLRLLPHLQRKIYIHVHDVFLPFGMPIGWLLDKQIFWTEQYLLLALITDNPKVKVLYGSAYHQYANSKELNKLMKNKYPAGGGSFWFEYNGRMNDREQPER